jgi:hypothetical protein
MKRLRIDGSFKEVLTSVNDAHSEWSPNLTCPEVKKLIDNCITDNQEFSSDENSL